MATRTRKKPRAAAPCSALDRETVLGFYRTMLLARRLEDCGAPVQRSLVAAKVAEERHGISTEVIARCRRATW